MTEQEFQQTQSAGQVNEVQTPAPTNTPDNLTDPTPDDIQAIISLIRRPRRSLLSVPDFTPKTWPDSFQFINDGTIKELAVYIDGEWVAFPPTPPLSRVRVHTSNDTSVSGATQLPFNTLDFDTKSEFDVTSHQFTPLVSGYYAVYASAYFSGATTNQQYATKIYVNNAEVSESNKIRVNASDDPFTIPVADIVFLNAGDHLDIYGYTNGGASPTVNHGSTITYLTIQQLS